MGKTTRTKVTAQHNCQTTPRQVANCLMYMLDNMPRIAYKQKIDSLRMCVTLLDELVHDIIYLENIDKPKE